MDDKSVLIQSVLNAKILAIIGLEKNTGKTETLNFIVKCLTGKKNIALTSIGTDGEEKDIVFGSPKPSVYVDEGQIYTTTEFFFKRRTVLSEILYVSTQTTPTGRLIIARACEPGKVILSGPPTTAWMKEVATYLSNIADLVIIDGALSRFSQAKPSIADSVILATGAAYSLEKREIIRHTKYVYNLCTLDVFEKQIPSEIVNSNHICTFDGREWKKTNVSSALNLQKLKEIEGGFSCIYIPGALTDSVLRTVYDKQIIVRDFTKIFISYEYFVKYRPNIKVLEKTNVIGITVNPYSPTGYLIDSESIINELRKVINIPIIDVRR
ncbi:MAG: hypothetical protein ABDH59_03310 [Fervidobacterium sp.]